MKTTITLIAAMLLLMMAGCTQSKEKKEEVPADARYPFKSAIIKKNIPEKTYPDIIYIDDYGAKEAIETTEEYVSGKIIQILQIRIPGGGVAIHVNLVDKTASLMSSEAMDGITFMNAEDLKDYKEVGEEMVADKPCKIYRRNPSELDPSGPDEEDSLWIWNGILMQQFTSFGEIRTGRWIESFQENVPIPPEKFEIPKGIKIKESPNE